MRSKSPTKFANDVSGMGGAPGPSRPPALYPERVEAVAAIIRKDFSKCHSVATLARKAGLTEGQLQAAFQSMYGKTVMRYARELRLHYAHEQLEQHGYPLRIICEMAGYPDASNFSVAFLREFGYRPGKVQRKH